MRDRLIELLRSNNAAPEKTCPRFGTGENCEGCKYLTDDIGCDYIAREADYLLANGVIVPPCEVGDTVYAIWRGDVLEAKVFGVKINQYKRIEIFLDLSVRAKDDRYTFSKTLMFNHDVFLTREEAEAALVNYESSKIEKGR